MVRTEGAADLPVKVKVLHRPITRPRLELIPWELRVVIPENLGEDYAYGLIDKHRRWITRKYRQLREAAVKAEKLELVDRAPDEFKRLVRSLARRYAEELGVKVKGVYVRIMTRKWGSCSFRGNINMSSLARYLPDELVEYLVYHEVCHLVERSHGKRFWRLVALRFPNYGELREKLLAYQVKLAMLGLLRL